MRKAFALVFSLVVGCVCSVSSKTDIRSDGRAAFVVPNGFKCHGDEVGVDADGVPVILFHIDGVDDIEIILRSNNENTPGLESFEADWEMWRDPKTQIYETGIVSSGAYKVNGNDCYYRVLGYNSHGIVFYWHYYVLCDVVRHRKCIISTCLSEKSAPSYLTKLVESVRFDKRSVTRFKPFATFSRPPRCCSVKKAFGLDFSYGGYVFQGNLYPLHDGRWVVLSRWCIDEEGTIYTTNKDGEEVPAASLYKDPFGGSKYPVIPADSVYFWTRNYGGQAIRFYSSAGGKDFKDTVNFECPLQAVDADIKTRRILCRTNPSDQIWSEPENDDEKEWKRPYVSVEGWIDEEWVCANLLTTCP
ncbi:MAG: hypothetical protein II495_04335 [Paludibacteraceae bacterium]|nr:hypothetical protein [Paludibacteraceae bacterium]